MENKMNIAKLKRFFQPVSQRALESGALLVVRLIVGAAFMIHGWGKIQSPLTWMGPESPFPGFLQFLAALAEFGGGIALILGLLTPLAALGIGFTMIVAVYLHMIVLKDPFVNVTGGGSYELALVFLGICLLILAQGAGKFSLDATVFGERNTK